MLCHLNETVQPIHLQYYSVLVQRKKILCCCYAETVLVQGACLLSGIHGWSWLSAQPSKAVVCLCCIFFLALQILFSPFLYASNVGDGAWKCPFVSEFALGRPCDAGWQQSHSTGGFWRGILHISISWQKKLFHVRMLPPISKHTQMMSVSWRLVSSCKNSQFPTFLCSFPCLSLLSLERSAIQGWVIILFYKIITTVCCNFSAFTWHLHECSASLWNSHTHLFFFSFPQSAKIAQILSGFSYFPGRFCCPRFPAISLKT